MDYFIKGLNRDLHFLKYMNNIGKKYLNFTITLYVYVAKFSTKVSYKNNNRTINLWYDSDSKMMIKAIRDVPNEILKLDNTNIYKHIIKRKKRYIDRKNLYLL